MVVGFSAQAADVEVLFGNTLVWTVTGPDGSERVSTFKFKRDGSVLASQGEVVAEGTWAIKGDQNGVTVMEPDGTPEDPCSPLSDLKGVAPGSEWDFVIREKIPVKAKLVAGQE